jgi:hypothetical protein
MIIKILLLKKISISSPIINCSYFIENLIKKGIIKDIKIILQGYRLKIYIYGNQSFKKDIHQTLEHSNIKFKIDANIVIEEISNLTKLKQAIKENPKDIYLIDDEKIIKKNSLNKKIKFLAPKDGIDEDFLLESGVADLSIDSLKELPKYIIKRYEEIKEEEPLSLNVLKSVKNNDEIELESVELDEELSMLLSKGDKNNLIVENQEDLDDIFDIEKDINLDDIDDFINSMDNTQNDEKEDIDNFQELVDFNDNFGLNNISYDYDDDDVLFREESIKNNEITPENDVDNFKDLNFFDEEVMDEELPNLEDLNILDNLDFLNKDIVDEKQDIEEIEDKSLNDLDFFGIPKEENKQIEWPSQGNKMNDEFFELDSISEKDLLEALDYKIEEKSSTEEFTLSSKHEVLSVDSSNVNDLSLLISKLLSNKTLEITIKIKD